MVCPKCQANVAEDSNFCPHSGTPFKTRQGFVATLWQDHKPGFLVLSLLIVAMLGSIVRRFGAERERLSGRKSRRLPLGRLSRSFQGAGEGETFEPPRYPKLACL
jgi:hypothetical protein